LLLPLGSSSEAKEFKIMAPNVIQLENVWVHDLDKIGKNSDGTLDPAVDYLTDKDGRVLDPDAPELKELKNKLGVSSLKGLWLTHVDAYLRHLRIARQAADKGNYKKTQDHLEDAKSYSKNNPIVFDGKKANQLRLQALTQGISMAIQHLSLSAIALDPFAVQLASIKLLDYSKKLGELYSESRRQCLSEKDLRDISGKVLRSSIPS